MGFDNFQLIFLLLSNGISEREDSEKYFSIFKIDKQSIKAVFPPEIAKLQLLYKFILKNRFNAAYFNFSEKKFSINFKHPPMNQTQKKIQKEEE